MRFILTTILSIIIGMSYSSNKDLSQKGKIKGAIVEKANKQPLEYATVSLYNAKTGALVSGTITDYLGHFKIDHPNEGEYYLLITYIGLKDKKTEPFQVKNNQSISMGNIFLESSSEKLDEVQVVSRRAPIQYKIDKKVINVDKQLTSESGTAVDVLENIPSVQVDIEGNVSLRGSSGFTVLIDGKPTILEPSDALRQIPSSIIENIEIITNPSVKYEPDGATGIINIITKKNYLDGLSGLVNINAGTYDTYSGDMQLNYRLNKISFVLGASYSKRPRPGDLTNNRKTFTNDTIFFVNSKGTTSREFGGYNFRAGIEYNPTKNDYLSLTTKIGHWNMLNQSTLRYDNWTMPESSYFSYNSADKTEIGGDYISLDGVYQHDFGSTDDEKLKTGGPRGNMYDGMGTKISHSLKLEFNYRDMTFDENTTNTLRDLNDTLIGGKKNVETGPTQMMYVKADYTLPVGKKDKFETGLQFRSGKSGDNTDLYLYNTETGGIDLVPEFSNNTDYIRNIYAIYSLYAGYFGKFGYQAGLRAEYTDRKVTTTGQDPFIIDRWDIFPTVHLSYSLPKDHQIMASYSRRIDRPRGWNLEPFITWQDQYNVRKGNPELKPEYIDSYDAGYLMKFGENLFSLESYYRVTHNKMERISSVYQENVMLNTIDNVGEDYSLGLEAMLNIGIAKWWDISLSGNLYDYKIEGVLYDEPFKKTSTNWNSRLNNTFRLWDKAQLQLSGRYNSETVTAQGTSSGYYTLDGAFKLSFLNKQLTANLQARDIFGTALRNYTQVGRDFNLDYKFTPKAPMLIVSISYRFNNYKINRRSNSGDSNGGGDDL